MPVSYWESELPNMKKIPSNRTEKTDQFKIGRSGFAKISAVEGMRISASMKSDFEEFERQGLSAQKRRTALSAKYGRPR